jgi:hypothetical protein
MSHDMKKIEDIFSSLMGQLVWSVRRGYAGYLAMEFGKPHLQVRNPKISHSDSARVREILAQRRVFLCGQWSLFIKSGKWAVFFKDRIIVNDDDFSEDMRKALDYIDGQKLIKFDFDEDRKTLNLEFDLGGRVEIDSEDDGMEDDLLNLRNFDDGNIYWWSCNTGLSYEASTKISPGEISEQTV